MTFNLKNNRSVNIRLVGAIDIEKKEVEDDSGKSSASSSPGGQFIHFSSRPSHHSEVSSSTGGHFSTLLLSMSNPLVLVPNHFIPFQSCCTFNLVVLYFNFILLHINLVINFNLILIHFTLIIVLYFIDHEVIVCTTSYNYKE